MAQQIGKLLRILITMLLVAVAVPTVAADSPPAQGGDYPLGPGDELKISVFDHPELQTELRVSEGARSRFH